MRWSTRRPRRDVRVVVLREHLLGRTEDAVGAGPGRELLLGHGRYISQILIKNKRSFFIRVKISDYRMLPIRSRWGDLVRKLHLAIVVATLGSATARADDIPIVTLTEAGPNQEVPTHRSF